MQTWSINRHESEWRRTLNLAGARWAQEDGDQRAAAFAYYLLLHGSLGGIVAFLLWLYLSSCVGAFGICLCAAQAEVRGRANDHPEKQPEG